MILICDVCKMKGITKIANPTTNQLLPLYGVLNRFTETKSLCIPTLTIGLGDILTIILEIPTIHKFAFRMEFLL